MQESAYTVTETLQGKKEQTSRSVVSCFSDSVAVLQSRRTVESVRNADCASSDSVLPERSITLSICLTRTGAACSVVPSGHRIKLAVARMLRARTTGSSE